jgi:hypothetical protein
MSTIAINYYDIGNIESENMIVTGQVYDLLKVFKYRTEKVSSENKVVLKKLYFKAHLWKSCAEGLSASMM